MKEKLIKIQLIAEKHFSNLGMFKVSVQFIKNHLAIDIVQESFNSFSTQRIDWFRDETEHLITYVKGNCTTYIETKDKSIIRISYLIST
ncbi:hypothetical protein C1631_022760 [Chryseobacterium phosphatilyticum]|uniref:Uncharacterized protein n=1 Tax=Chryseobacterium phosphatilyticum TaxID=475075 RepID=A0A316WMN3_9FLAO|nr:hypothetical protein C1631_022760 [Chryseobacterium phosphatilyticum]